MNTTTAIIFLIAFVVGYFVFMWLVARHYWRRFKKEGRSAKAFNYRIVDIWAATLALTPTLICASFAIEEFTYGFAEPERGRIISAAIGCSILTLVMLTGQLMGIYIGRVWNELPGWGGENKTLSSAALVVAGGLLGLLLPLIYYFLVCVICVVIMLLGEAPWISIVIVFLGAVIRAHNAKVEKGKSAK